MRFKANPQNSVNLFKPLACTKPKRVVVRNIENHFRGYSRMRQSRQSMQSCIVCLRANRGNELRQFITPERK